MSTFTTSTPVDYDPATDVVQGHRSGVAPVRPMNITLPKLGYVSATTTAVYLDGNRTDTYTADGTPDRPFKTVADSLTYLSTQGMAGVGYYATGTYTTSGGTYTLPDLPILVHGNKSTITGSSTFNIPGPYVAKNLDVDGNVKLQDGSAPHVDRLEGQTIDGSVSIGGTVTTHLDSVTITGNLSLSSGTAPVYLSPDSVIEGNITGSTSRLQQVVSVEVESVAADRVVITNEAGSFESSSVTTTELGNLTGSTGNIQTQITDLGSALGLKADLILAPIYIDSATTTAYEISAADSGKLIICQTTTATIALTWPSLSAGVSVAVVNVGSGLVTSTASGTTFDLTGTTLSGANTSAVFEYRSATAITNAGELS